MGARGTPDAVGRGPGGGRGPGIMPAAGEGGGIGSAPGGLPAAWVEQGGLQQMSISANRLHRHKHPESTATETVPQAPEIHGTETVGPCRGARHGPCASMASMLVPRQPAPHTHRRPGGACACLAAPAAWLAGAGREGAHPQGHRQCARSRSRTPAAGGQADRRTCSGLSMQRRRSACPHAHTMPPPLGAVCMLPMPG